jgi:hypothetical protein
MSARGSPGWCARKPQAVREALAQRLDCPGPAEFAKTSSELTSTRRYVPVIPNLDQCHSRVETRFGEAPPDEQFIQVTP